MGWKYETEAAARAGDGRAADTPADGRAVRRRGDRVLDAGRRRVLCQRRALLYGGWPDCLRGRGAYSRAGGDARVPHAESAHGRRRAHAAAGGCVHGLRRCVGAAGAGGRAEPGRRRRVQLHHAPGHGAAGGELCAAVRGGLCGGAGRRAGRRDGAGRAGQADASGRRGRYSHSLRAARRGVRAWGGHARGHGRRGRERAA